MAHMHEAACVHFAVSRHHWVRMCVRLPGRAWYQAQPYWGGGPPFTVYLFHLKYRSRDGDAVWRRP